MPPPLRAPTLLLTGYIPAPCLPSCFFRYDLAKCALADLAPCAWIPSVLCIVLRCRALPCQPWGTLGNQFPCDVSPGTSGPEGNHEGFWFRNPQVTGSPSTPTPGPSSHRSLSQKKFGPITQSLNKELIHIDRS